MSEGVFRECFPILKTTTYLASHSLGAVPEATADALSQYYQEWATQGILAWDGPWWNAVLDFSNNLEEITHAHPGTIVPMENATRGMAAVMSCFDLAGPRNEICLTNLEFTTSYPFWRGLEARGAKLRILESPDGVTVPVEAFERAVTDKTLLIATSHVYFRSGAIQDLKALAQLAHKNGAYILGDGYQCIGTVPTNFKDLDIDFYVGGSHKWLCGGPGAGFLYVRKDLQQKLTPTLSGWFGLKNPFGYEPGTKLELSDGIFRFLAGTPNVPGLYAAREGINLILEVGIEKIRTHSKELTTHIVEQAQQRKLQVRSPLKADQRSGMVCLEFPHSKDVCETLNAHKIIVDWRPNCGIRVSPHFYNSTKDIEVFFSALDKAIAAH